MPMQIKKQVIAILSLFSVLCFLFSQGYAQNFAHKEEKISIAAPEASLKIGEQLRYSVDWLGIPVAKIILTVQGIEKIDGNDCYHIMALATPNKFLRKFYDVQYTVHTYIDTKTFLTRRFEKTRVSKGKSNYIAIDFDREKKEVRYKELGSAPSLNISVMRDQVAASVPVTLKILDGTQDLFSSFYYLRSLELKENQNYELNIYYEQRNWVLNAKVERPFSKDIRKIGSFAIFGVSLDSNLGELIIGKRKMLVYFTADSRRIPVEFKLKTSVGSIRGRIQDIPLE